MSRRTLVTSLFGALALAWVSLAGSAGAVDPTVTQNAITYLKSQQISGTTPATGSGAWDTSPAFEFVTSEAVLAIAEQAQTGTNWSTGQALTAVQNATNPQGKNPLPFLDLVASGPLSPGKAAKLIVLVAKPLGMDPTSFDPAGDGSPVDLVATVGSGNPDGSFGPATAFNQTLYAALAKKLVDGSVPALTVQYIQSKQKTNGGWSFDPTDPTADPDVDTTSFAIQALIAGGVASTDASVRNGLAFTASQQNADGTWSAFGSVSSESTSRALLAIAAAGFDPNSSCWRDTVAPGKAGTPFVAGDTALAGLQQGDGSISGPGSFSPPFSTAQAVEGLERNWLPIVKAVAPTCGSAAAPAPASSAPAGAVTVTPRFTG